MTRKDYNALADAISVVRAGVAYAPAMSGPQRAASVAAVGELAHAVAAVCAADNPRFDRDRFLIACGVPR